MKKIKKTVPVKSACPVRPGGHIWLRVKMGTFCMYCGKPHEK